LTSNEAAVSLSVGGDAGREIAAMTRTKCISWFAAQKRMEAVQNKKRVRENRVYAIERVCMQPPEVRRAQMKMT